MARFDGWTSAAYALGGIAILLAHRGLYDLETLLLGLGLLVLAAAQVWLGLRRVGPDKTRHQLLLGPFYALIAIAWFHRGFSREYGPPIGFGLCFSVIAALYSIRAARTLRNGSAND